MQPLVETGWMEGVTPLTGMVPTHWRKLPHVVAERVKTLTPSISLAAQRGNEKVKTIKSVN